MYSQEKKCETCLTFIICLFESALTDDKNEDIFRLDLYISCIG